MEGTRKKLIIGMVVVFANILLPGKFCLGSKDKSSAERINALISARAFIVRVQEKAKNRLIDPNQLSQKILGNPGKYQDRAKAWEILQQEEKNDDLLKWYTKEINLILQGLNLKRPEGVDDFFTKEEREAFLKCPDQVVKLYLDKNFGKSQSEETTIFAKARKKAYTSQLDKLIKDVYPTEDEVDTAVAKRQLNNLRIKILDQLIKKQKEPVFSENKNMLSSDFVDPIVDDAEKQLEEQGLIVVRSFGASYVVPEDISSFIKDEIIKYQENLKKEKQGKTIANKVYTTFPSVQEKIADRANEIAIKRFRDVISEMSFPVGKEVLKKLISESLSAHADRDKSWDTCLEGFRQGIVNKAIDNHLAKAPESKRSDFRKFLTGLISNSDQSCKNAMNALVEKSLKQNFEQARKEISQEQLREFFEPLEKEVWKPSEQEIDSRYNRPLISSSVVSEPLKMPGISSKSFVSASLLEETIEMVRQTEEKAIKRGLDALKNQMETVEELEFQMRNEVKSMNDLTIEKIVQIYTEKVKLTWSSSSKEFVKDYANLFTRTQDEIKRRAKSIVDVEIARQQQVAIDKARADAEAQLKGRGRSEKLDTEQQGRDGGAPGIPSGPPDGKGPVKKQEELGDEMPDVILDFSYQYGKVYAEIMFLKEQRAGAKLEIQSNVRRNLPSLLLATKIFADWLKDTSQKAEKDQQEISAYVFVRVFENPIFYSMVYYFRECLKAALAQVGDKRIKIHWYDRLFDEPDDVEKYKGKPVLPPQFDKKTMPRLA